MQRGERRGTQSGRVGSGPGGWEGLGAGSRDKQEIYTCGAVAGLWWVGAGRELWVLVAAKTRKQKPETRKPVAVGNSSLVCPIEITDNWPIKRE